MEYQTNLIIGLGVLAVTYLVYRRGESIWKRVATAAAIVFFSIAAIAGARDADMLQILTNFVFLLCLLVLWRNEGRESNGKE